MSKLLLVVAGALCCLSVAPRVPGAGLAAERVNGTYVREKDGMHEGVVTVQLSSKGTLNVTVDLLNTFGGYNNGSGAGEAKLRGNEATFTPTGSGRACKISVVFAPANVLLVSQEGDSADCLFGHGVYADGSYSKVRGGRLAMGSQPDEASRAADPKIQAQLSTDAATEVQAAGPAIASKVARIGELAASRKQLQNALSASKKELEAHTKAGAAAAKKREAALTKPSANPTASALLSTAQAEYVSARAAGRAAVALAAQLRDVEDELAQLAAEANQAAVDAQLGLVDMRKAWARLSSLATKERDEAKKVALGGAADAVKGSSLVGGSAAQLEAKQKKAQADDAKLAADAAANRASLKQADASLKAAKR